MRIEDHWQRVGVLAILLFPLSLLFRLAVSTRQLLFEWGLLRTWSAPVPVIVVGNITVGGSGKTPLVVWLVRYLREQGYRPGIVARGYGGKARYWPQQVRPDSDPQAVGDEAVLLAQRTGCPVCVAPVRSIAVQELLQHTDCNIVIADDGLQHYALARDFEIAVVDGQRRFGNGLALPAGPLREPVSRLKSVDLVVCNGQPEPGEFAMKLLRPEVYPLRGDAPAESVERFQGTAVRALAGIGNPQRFFDMLRRHGMEVEGHAFPDHHPYRADDLAFDDAKPLLMTEKDAVKCRRIAHPENAWVVSVEAQPEAMFVHYLAQALKRLSGPDKPQD